MVYQMLAKAQIKNCIVVFILIKMSFCFALPTYASQELINQLQQGLLQLIQIQDELIDKSKEAKPYARRIKYLARRLNLLVLFALPNKCKRGTKQAISGIEKSIVKLEHNKCQMQLTGSVLATESLNLSNRCIPGDILSTYLPLINDSFQSVKSIFLVDEGINSVPDICENQGVL